MPTVVHIHCAADMSTDNHASPSLLKPFLNTSSIDDLSYIAPSAEGAPSTPVVTGRKTYKTLKEKKEAVWPPHIEAALFEGYIPLTSTDSRH